MPRAIQAVQHSGTPTIAAAQTSAGVSGVAVASGSSDQAGQVSITTGTTAAAGAQATVSFASAYRSAPKCIILTHNDDASGATAFELRVKSAATGSFIISTPSTPANSKTYVVAYAVIPEDGE